MMDDGTQMNGNAGAIVDLMEMVRQNTVNP